MLTKYKLTIDGVERDLAPDSIKNWGEIECAMKRNDYDGIMRSFTSKFEFVGDVADDIRELHIRKGIEAKASVDVYVVDDYWHYSKVFSSELDFSSISWNAGGVAISCIDNSLAAMIKSRKGTKYEFEVGKDIPISNRLAYDRVQMLNTVEHTVTGVTSNNDGTVMIKVYHTGGTHVRYIQTYLCGEMETYENNPILSTDQTNQGDTCMFETQRDVSSFTIRGEVMFDSFNLNTEDDGTGTSIPLNNLQLVLCKQEWNENGTRKVDEHGTPICEEMMRLNDQFSLFTGSGFLARTDFGTYNSMEEFQEASEEYRASHNRRLPYNAIARVRGTDGNMKYYITEVSTETPSTSPEWNLVNNDHTYKFVTQFEFNGVRAGERIFLGVDADVESSWYQWIETNGGHYNLYFPIRCSIKSQWTSRANTVEIDTLRPHDVAQALLDKVADGKVYASVEISDYDDRLANTRILPAECIRGISKAKFYSTFNDFCSWMETVFGYTYRIGGTATEPILYFEHRCELFPDDAPITNIDNAIDVEYSVESKLLYSTIEAGYSKKEYNKVCGRDEWNFLNEYSTGLEVGEKKLSLKSPYRADCYGIEFLAQERAKDSKDNKADNDTFFILCNSELNAAGLLAIDRTTYPVSGAFSNTVFNGGFSPYHCLKANEAFICAMGTPIMCKFASNDGNSSVRVKYGSDYVSIHADVEIERQLFTAGKLSFTSDVLVDDVEGLVEVEKDGLIYTGYIEEVDMRYAREEAYDYKLIVKNII